MSIRYIFCISTGRSGTAYLSQLLSQLDSCNSYHEQKPILHDRVMRSYIKGNAKPLNNLLSLKLDRIQKNTNAIYADTSHVFIKSFGWEIPKYISQSEIGVIILKRDKEKVVQSMQRVHSGPFTYLGRKWILTPYKNALIDPPMNFYLYHFYRYLLMFYWIIKGERKSIIKTYPNFFKMQSTILLNWYYDEVYALGQKFQETFPYITYANIDLEELNDIKGFEKIVKFFELEDYYRKESVMPFIGKMYNLKR